MLMRDLRNNMRWVGWRHSLSREGGHVEELGVSKMHSRVWFLVLCKLSPSGQSIIGWLYATSCFPILPGCWLQVLDIFQSVEFLLDRGPFGFCDRFVS